MPGRGERYRCAPRRHSFGVAKSRPQPANSMRRKAWLLALLLLPGPALRAQDIAPPEESVTVPRAYKILRWTEDYSYLSDVKKRSDLFDPIKYMPLRANEPDWYLTLGGEVRERFEGAHDPNFGIKSSDNSYWLQRLTMLGDLHLGPRVRLFVEGISGEIAGESRPPPAVQKDPVNLQFAFVDVLPYLTEDERLTLRAGRFGMSLGSGRLVATRASPNIPFKFDGFEAIYDRPAWHAVAFVTRPVLEYTDRFDNDDSSTEFWGG